MGLSALDTDALIKLQEAVSHALDAKGGGGGTNKANPGTSLSLVPRAMARVLRTHTHDIRMSPDGTMSCEAVVKVPEAVKTKGGRVGVITGSHENPSGQKGVNLEITAEGKLRLWW